MIDLSSPRVSVVMPVFNAASTLPTAIESVLAQSLRAFELLVIDDGSSDQSPDIAERFAASDHRIRVVRLQHVGLVGALNRGCREARSQYVARMDADDLMHPKRLGHQWDAMQADPSLAVLACQVEVFSEGLLSEGLARYFAWQNSCVSAQQVAANIYREAPFAHPSVMLRRDVLTAIGMYRDGDFPEDYELWLRLHAAGYKMEKLPKVLMKLREHARRATHNDARYSDQAFSKIRARYLADDSRMKQPYVVWGAGRRTRQRLGLLLDLVGCPVAWVDIDRRKIGQSIQGSPVVSPDWLLANRQAMILAAVRNHGAMEQISSWLEQNQFQIATHWLPVG
ncbi:MAG: glycosyl transferase [Lysobacteraceae bacterium]|nr:MAG: glycosyl transferase [Xanthomonadaceae bacterium]